MEICRVAPLVIEMARRMANPYVVGETSIRAKGIGVEPEDYRDYTEGDDMRFIDWRISSRAVGTDGNNRILLRERRSERSMETAVVVDLSSSMMYRNKMIAALYALSFISSMALGFKDRLLLILAGRRIRHIHVSPKMAPYILVNSVCRLENWGEKLDLKLLARLLVRLGRIPVLLLTDTAHPVDELEWFTKIVRSSEREIGFVFCSDSSEIRPPKGSALLIGSEEGTSHLWGIEEAVRRHRSKLFALMKTSLIPYVEIVHPGQAKRICHRLMMLYLVVRNALPQ